MPRIKKKVRTVKTAQARGKLTPKQLRRARRNRKCSSLEKQVHVWLKAEGIPFIREKPISRMHVDIFFEPRTVIELNGCFWHGHAVCIKEPKKMHKSAQFKDARRHAFLRRLGFDVIVIWECEVEKEPDRVRAVLRALYENSRKG